MRMGVSCVDASYEPLSLSLPPFSSSVFSAGLSHSTVASELGVYVLASRPVWRARFWTVE